MKFIGKPKGVLFPKSTIPIEVCKHRYGAIATISHSTDTLVATSRYAAELFAFKYNIGLTANHTYINDMATDLLSCEQSERLGFGLYHQTDRWCDLTYNGTDMSLKYPLIPDYYATNWTSLGVAVFGVTLGSSKAARYPNHGQEMYDLTGGAKGFNFITGISGASNLAEYYNLVDYELSVLKSTLGHSVSAGSYRNGQFGGGISLLPKLLMMRTSSYSKVGDSSIFYNGLNRSNMILRANSTRWWDTWHDGVNNEAFATAYVQQEIGKAIAGNGWFVDFGHWHNFYDGGDVAALGRLYSIFNSSIGSNFVNRISFSEAVEYAFFRDLVNRVSAFEYGGKVHVVLQSKDYYKGTHTNGVNNDLDLSLLNTPVSVKVDLTGTGLANKNIKSNAVGIRSIGSNQYILDIPFLNKKEGFLSAVIEEQTNTTDYYSFALPSIVSATVNNQILTVITNVPTRCVTFISNRNSAIETALLLERSNILKLTHTITLTTSDQGKDIYIGVITKEKQSVLSEVYRFT